MRYMRLVASLLMLPPVFGVLTGCGGGNSVSSVQRTVTLTIQWPVASKASSLAHSRASVSTAQSVTVEVYDGTIPLIRKWLVTPSGTSATTLSLNLPAKGQNAIRDEITLRNENHPRDQEHQ